MKGVQAQGHPIEKVFLGDGTIQGCKGCGACQIKKDCVLKDKMQAIYPLFESADTIVLAFPFYFWTF